MSCIATKLDSGVTGEIALPIGSLVIQAALMDKYGMIYAYWNFDVVPPSSGTKLRIDLGILDQGSVILSGGNCNPVAQTFAIAALPTAGTELFLKVRNTTDWPPFERVCHLDLANQFSANSVIETWQRALTAPTQWFYVELTTFCNLKCPFCPSKDLKRKRQHMSLDLAKTVFGKISDYIDRQDLREAYVQFRPMVFLHVMGEPVLHPKLQEVVQIAHDAGLAVGLFTNVTLLNAKNIAKLIDAEPELVTLSVNAINETGYTELGAKDRLEDQHNRVQDYLVARAAAGAFGTSVDLQYMTALDDVVNGDGLLHDNREVWRIYEFWQERGRAIHRNIPSSTRSIAQVRPQDLDDPIAPRDDPSYRLSLGHGVHLAIKSGCSFGNAALPEGMTVIPTPHGRCPFNSPFQQMSIFVDGSVSFCNLDYENTVNIGNLQTSGIDELWNSDRMVRIRNTMAAGMLTESVCQKCLGQVVPC